MYKKWSIGDIEEVIKDISTKWNYPCNIKIEISTRAKKRMGAFFYKKIGENIEPIKFVFAKDLIDGKYSEDIVREVIIHEYIHYYCDISTNINNGHNKFFKRCCIKSGISSNTTFKYYKESAEDIKKHRYNIYCSRCNNIVCTHVKRDATKRKLKYYISKCCKEKLYCDNL